MQRGQHDRADWSATVDLSKAIKADVFDLTSPDIRVCYVMRGDNPVYGGVVWTRKYDSANRSLQIGGSDWGSWFAHRYVLPVLNPASYSDPTYVAAQVVNYSATDQNAIMRGLIATAQSHPAGDIKVVPADTTNAGQLRDRTWYGYKLTYVEDAIKDLAGVLAGSDFAWDVGATDASGKPARLLRLGAPTLGKQNSGHRFELGGNVLSYTWPSDGTKYSSRVFSQTDGTAEGTPIAVYEDTASYTYGWPLSEMDTSYSNITDNSTLYQHAQADQSISRRPVVLPTLTIKGDKAPTLDVISVGDDAQFIIKAGIDEFFTGGLTTTMRIVRIDVKPRDSGGEDATLTMAPMLDNTY